MVALDVVVAIPAPLVGHTAGVDLNEANTSFYHAAGSETLARDVVAAFFVNSIKFFDVLGLLFDVESLRGSGLHAVGKFETFDTRL